MYQITLALKPIFKTFLISLMFVCSTSNANRYLDYAYDNCWRFTPSSVLHIKYLLGKVYFLKNQVSAKKLSQNKANILWNEEFEKFLDGRHEVQQEYNETSNNKNLNEESLAKLRIMQQIVDLAIMDSVKEFSNRDSMPPDSRISRVYFDSCQKHAS
jgi:hypothetical protein